MNKNKQMMSALKKTGLRIKCNFGKSREIMNLK